MPLARLPRGDPGRVLRSANCPTHATLTSVFETPVLRRFLHAVRVGLDLRSRRSRLTQLPLSVAREHDIERLILPVSGAPTVAILPIFAAPPAHVDGRPYNGRIEVRGAHVFQVSGPPLGARAQLLNRQLGIKRLEFTATLEGDTYERFLLKIAYCLAVFQLGLDGIADAYVIPSILGGPNDMGRWLGCDGEDHLGTDAMHALSWRIRLRDRLPNPALRQLQCPEYVVAVGRAA
jgi:hypothetical protein